VWDRCNDFGCLWGVGDDGGYGDGSVNALGAFNSRCDDWRGSCHRPRRGATMEQGRYLDFNINCDSLHLQVFYYGLVPMLR
jgi:hypothetical protein